METIVAGLVASCSMLFLLVKLDLRKCLGYDWAFDIFITVFLTYLFSGTYAGMSAAMIGGLLLSVKLVVLKKIIGAEKIDFKASFVARRFVWIETTHGALQR